MMRDDARDIVHQKIGDEISYLKFYYAKLFPYSDLFKWLSYGNDGKHPRCDQSYFRRREFAFSLKDRYQSFGNFQELKGSVEKQCPSRIDIGPVYTVDPSRKSAYPVDVFFPMERELVFDIEILVSTISFGSIVVDEACIVGFVIPKHEAIVSELRRKWQNNGRQYSISEEDVDVARWGQLKKVLKSRKLKASTYVEEIVFNHVFPRIDMKVSQYMNHLLKAPFSVHPETGRVCVPIDPNKCEEFDPFGVPTLSQLLKELNTSGAESDRVGSELEQTSLGKSIVFFRLFFLQPLLRHCKDELESSYNKTTRQNKESLLW